MNDFIKILTNHLEPLPANIVIWGNTYLGREIAFHIIHHFNKAPLCFLDKAAEKEMNFPAYICGVDIPVVHPDSFDWKTPDTVLILGAKLEKAIEEMKSYAAQKGVLSPLNFLDELKKYDEIAINQLHEQYEIRYGKQDEIMSRQLYQRISQLVEMQRSGLLSLADIKGKRILDWECGNAMFARLFLLCGAASVTASDTWYPVDAIEPAFEKDVHYYKGAIETMEESNFDLIFSNTVTEHIQNLVSAFQSCYQKLSEGGIFFTTHGNYYCPDGSHDYRMLTRKKLTVVPCDPPCYTIPDCGNSEIFRNSLSERDKPILTTGSVYLPCQKQDIPLEKEQGCENCWYYKRSRPWAHLLYQEDIEIFPKNFKSGHEYSFLNKITPFQLKQYLIEAGFALEDVWKSYYYNDIPSELLDPFRYGFTKEDLLTEVVRIRAVKK